MFCPNIANKQVVQEFNEIVQALGGTPLSIEEFKNGDLRSQREGVDYAAMEAAYVIWHRNNGNSLELAPNGASSNLFHDLLELNNGNRDAAIIAKAKVYTNEFFNWFGDWINDSKNSSEIIDENGEPCIVYTGTKKDFYEFKPEYTKTASKGFFFSVDKDVANTYGNVKAVFLNIKNLKEEYVELSSLDLENGKYDGISYFHNGAEAFVVWNPNQIKSATDNNGQFSTTDNNINHHLSIKYYEDKYDRLLQYVKSVKVHRANWLSDFNKANGTNFGYNPKTKQITTRSRQIYGIPLTNDNDTETQARNRIDRALLLQYLHHKFNLNIKQIPKSKYDKMFGTYSNCSIMGNTVYIREGDINVLKNEWLIEEFLHPVIHQIYLNNKDVSTKLLNEAKKKYPKLCKQIWGLYRTQGQSVVDEEIITQVLSKYLNKEISDYGMNNRNLIDYILQFLQEIINTCKDLFGDIKISEYSKIPNSGAQIRNVFSFQNLAQLINSKEISFNDVLENNSVRNNMTSDIQTLNDFSNNSHPEEIFNDFIDRLGFDVQLDSTLKQGILDLSRKIIYSSGEETKEDMARLMAEVAVGLLDKEGGRSSRTYKLGNIVGYEDDNQYYQILKNREQIINDVANTILDNNFKPKQKEHKNIIQKSISVIKNLISSIIKNQDYYMSIIQNIADDITNKYSSWYNQKIAEGFQKKGLSMQTLKDSGKYDIYRIITKYGGGLDGSAAVRLQGSLYRSGEEDFHDLDFNAPFIKHIVPKIKDSIFFHWKGYRTRVLGATIEEKKQRVRDVIKKEVWDLIKNEPFIKELKETYNDISVKAAFHSKLGTCVTLDIDGTSVDLFYDPNYSDKIINVGEWKISDVSVAFSAKLFMRRNKDITDIINFRRNIQHNNHIGLKDQNDVSPVQSMIQGQKSGIYRVYQGRNSEFDGRKFNYYTINPKEASNYGSIIESKNINVKDYLQPYGKDKNKYSELLKEFKDRTGKIFDILDNSQDGLYTQNQFFEFLQNKGYKGLDYVTRSEQYKSTVPNEDSDINDFDNLYIVQFSEKENELDKLGEERMKECGWF